MAASNKATALKDSYINGIAAEVGPEGMAAAGAFQNDNLAGKLGMKVSGDIARDGGGAYGYSNGASDEIRKVKTTKDNAYHRNLHKQRMEAKQKDMANAPTLSPVQSNRSKYSSNEAYIDSLVGGATADTSGPMGSTSRPYTQIQDHASSPEAAASRDYWGSKTSTSSPSPTKNAPLTGPNPGLSRVYAGGGNVDTARDMRARATGTSTNTIKPSRNYQAESRRQPAPQPNYRAPAPSSQSYESNAQFDLRMQNDKILHEMRMMKQQNQHNRFMDSIDRDTRRRRDQFDREQAADNFGRNFRRELNDINRQNTIRGLLGGY